MEKFYQDFTKTLFFLNFACRRILAKDSHVVVYEIQICHDVGKKELKLWGEKLIR